MNFARFCEFWCFSLGKQARFTLNFCSGMPLRKVHELTFLWFGLPGPLLIKGGSLHDGFGGFDGFGSSGEHIALLCLSYKRLCQETTVTVLTVLAVSAVVAVSVVTATPLKLNPFHPD